MLDISLWSVDERRRVKGVFTDIDDTLTTNGVISKRALSALHKLQQAGITVIAITGRPVYWSAPFASEWPVDAIGRRTQ